MSSMKKLCKIAGDAALLTALALSPVAMAQDDEPTREERLAERQAQIDARREQMGETLEGRREIFSQRQQQREENVMRNRSEQAGENGVNPRRRAFEEGRQLPGPGEYARRRADGANPPPRAAMPQMPPRGGMPQGPRPMPPRQGGGR